MDDLVEIYEVSERCVAQLETDCEVYMQKLRTILWGESASLAENQIDLTSASPRPKTKRAKRLTSLQEDEGEGRGYLTRSSIEKHETSSSKSKHINIKDLPPDENGDVPEKRDSETLKSTLRRSEQLMPPPHLLAAPVVVTTSDTSFGRPQRLAKLKSEKNLKEPSLNSKLRRPGNGEVKIKLEAEQRQSQMHEGSIVTSDVSDQKIDEVNRSTESVVALPEKTVSIVSINSDDDPAERSRELRNTTETHSLRIMVKREKSSLTSASLPPAPVSLAAAPADVPEPTFVAPPADDSTVSSALSISSKVSSNKPKAQKSKKNQIVRPIKVERFSEVFASPVASRTRKGSYGRREPEMETLERPQGNQRGIADGSIYEDAVDNLPSKTAVASIQFNETVTLTKKGIANETITLGSAAPADATFNANVVQATFHIASAEATFVRDCANPNATVTIATKGLEAGDTTFNVAALKDDGQTSFVSARQSLATAKDTSLITEDESFEKPTKFASNLPHIKPLTTNTKLVSSAKAYKMPMRTNELFNPLVQSPVKQKVKAFENAVAEHGKTLRPKHTKENATPITAQGSTPTIGKLQLPALGRFLTPTQGTNITPICAGQIKKQASSASKIIAFPKAPTTTAIKAITRENTADDFRKGLHQLAEERKKQREQKHQLAAMQREAKERDRTERMAKLAKEREEKRLKKQLEAEQKKRELEEIQRKLRQNEEAPTAAAAAEAAKQKAAKAKQIQEQERLLLKQAIGNSAKAHMPPPQPKVQLKYTFDMLHEDDSTDEEDKVTYKRPIVPAWSRSQARAPAIHVQQHWPTDIIDNFFSVQPMTPDLKVIFPNIDKRLLKRNSSAMWATPPRYSELPKY